MIEQQMTDHPGVFIEEELVARKVKKGDLAFVLGISPAALSRIITGKVRISTSMALSLSEAMSIPAEYFLNLQMMYDLSRSKPNDPRVRMRAILVSLVKPPCK